MIWGYHYFWKPPYVTLAFGSSFFFKQVTVGVLIAFWNAVSRLLGVSHWCELCQNFIFFVPLDIQGHRNWGSVWMDPQNIPSKHRSPQEVSPRLSHCVPVWKRCQCHQHEDFLSISMDSPSLPWIGPSKEVSGFTLFFVSCSLNWISKLPVTTFLSPIEVNSSMFGRDKPPTWETFPRKRRSFLRRFWGHQEFVIFRHPGGLKKWVDLLVSQQVYLQQLQLPGQFF